MEAIAILDTDTRKLGAFDSSPRHQDWEALSEFLARGSSNLEGDENIDDGKEYQTCRGII